MGLSLLICNRHKQLSAVQALQCIIHGLSTHICARVWGVSICDNLQKLCLCTVYGWQLDFPNCILMLASTGLTTAFDYIAPCSAGKAADVCPWILPQWSKWRAKHARYNILLHPLRAGLERGKAWPCRGEQDNVKGAFGEERRKSKYIWKITALFFR